MLTILVALASAWTAPARHHFPGHSYGVKINLLAQTLGRLRFGAVRGPKGWESERDGPWKPGYWVEIEGGLDEGATVLIQDKSRIAPGLAVNDLCAVEFDE